MNTQDECFMARALQLADKSGGKNAPNPRVGCVIVHHHRIIGEGFHEQYGGEHAEVNAIRSVKANEKHLLSASTLYVTLEPCHHYGKTPPCVDLILQHKIPKVVIALEDPFEKVKGKSIEKLINNGVEVHVGCLEIEARKLCRRFLCFVERNRPYVILKFATSSDGFIGLPDQRVQISNELSKRLVHQWRSEEAAIMVGTNTALTDNPELNVRYVSGRSPIRILLDKHLKTPLSYHLLDGKQQTLVFTSKENVPDITETTFIPHNFNKKQNVLEILQTLKAKNIQSVIVEGGSKLLHSFIESGLWDEARVLVADKLLFSDGLPAPKLDPIYFSHKTALADNSIHYYFNH